MPTLHWIGKEKVINHHQDVPFRVLKHQYTFNNKGKLPTATNSYQQLPTATNSYQQLPTATNSYQQLPTAAIKLFMAII